MSCENLDLAVRMVHMQALHQWRFQFDSEHRNKFKDLMDEAGLTMEILKQHGLMLIPIDADMLDPSDYD